MEYSKTTARVIAVIFGILTIVILILAAYFTIAIQDLNLRLRVLEEKVEAK